MARDLQTYVREMVLSGSAIQHSFVNEKGNRIKLSVEPSGDDDLLVVKLEGPNSISENEITRMEAKNMAAAISSYLGGA